jgi:hypothetical protein
MGLVYRAIRRRHACGLLLILLLTLSGVVPALAADPVDLRNFGVVAFDLAFIAPLMLATWHGRRRQTGAPAVPPHGDGQGGRFDGVGLRTIALLGGVSFAACLAFGPSSPADLNRAWYAALHPLIDFVRGWSLGIAGIEHGLEARGQAADAALAGSRLALLWIVPGLTIIAGFLCRWSTMTPRQAASQCARNRARFSGVEVLRKTIDRVIVMLFVWSLPMAHTAAADVEPAVASLAQGITYVAVGCRGGILLFLGGIALDWLVGKLIVRWQVSRPPATDQIRARPVNPLTIGATADFLAALSPAPKGSAQASATFGAL